MPRKLNKRKAAQVAKKTQKPETKRVISIAACLHTDIAVLIAAAARLKEKE